MISGLTEVPMKRCDLKNNRGVALLITVTIITLLITVVVELNRTVRSAVVSTGLTRDQITLEQMASSGIQTAMAILVKDKMSSESDSLQEGWAIPEKLSEIVRAIPFEEGKLDIHIGDELGKIQINALVRYPEGQQFNISQRMLWDRLLGGLVSQFEFGEEIDPAAMLNAIKDWLDSNDDDAITGLTGAESGYYEDLDPPYACRNGPLPHLNELILIKGIKPEMFYGVGQIPGLADYLTIYGMSPATGKGFQFAGNININTAPVEILAALLPPGNEDLALEIDRYRTEESNGHFVHDISQPTWYQNVPGLSAVRIDPNLITTLSDIFRIQSKATLHDLSLTTTVIVLRERDTETGRWQCKVLQWKTD